MRPTAGTNSAPATPAMVADRAKATVLTSAGS